MFWEWEDEATATWKRFSPKLSAALTSAFHRGDPFENIPWRNSTMSVVFAPIHGLQINLASNTTLPVRRVDATPPLWEARVGADTWVKYERRTCKRIETEWKGWKAGSAGAGAFVNVDLRLGNGGARQTYRISFKEADGVRVGRNGDTLCVRQTAVPLPASSAPAPPPPAPVPTQAAAGAGTRRRGRASARSRKQQQPGTAASQAAVAAAQQPDTAASQAAVAAAQQPGTAASHAAAGGGGGGGDFGGAFVPVDTLEETCCICLDEDPRDDCGFVELRDCKHGFHETCIRTQFANRPDCPLCSTSYGERRGNQPEGTMNVQFYQSGQLPLSGHEGEGTILIQYSIPSGVQGPEHPAPGQQFAGTSRNAYLPDTEEGRGLLELLKVAFERKLVFTVGRSMTNGLDNVVTWSSIHHKTNPRGGQFGWPDPTYFERCREELRNVGVQ